MGVPVISTAMNGACEIMTEGVHGFVLQDPRDVESLRKRYRAMMDDSARRAMSMACVQLRGKLSQDQHVDRLIEVYRSLV